MTNTFYPLTISRLERETNDCVHISFEIPQDWKHTFSFKQGQYLTLKHLHEGEELRRSYSIVNAPSENNPTIEILVKKLENGIVSSFLNEEVKQGDVLEVLPPDGHFCTSYHANNEKVYIGIAAGSGISPVLSNVKEALYQEPKSKAYLFFGNKSSEDIIFKKQLEALKENFQDRLTIVYLFSREKHPDNELFEGRLTPEKIGALLKNFNEIPIQEATYFICGPSEMIKSVSTYLRTEEKIPSLQVMYEYFAAPDEEGNAEMSEEFKKIPNIESFVTLIIDDDEYNIHLNSKKESILDKALKENLPVPFACKGGVCCTCKAQVMEGEVFMEKNYALTEEEVEKGMVLSCQCHPVTNIVMLNFDV